MSQRIRKTRAFDEPGYYQIRFEGEMEERWSDQLSDLQISVMHVHDRPAVTKLTGWVADQTALSGILNLLYDLGFVVISVERLKPTENLSASDS
jgi:hypothetical protein